jgi:HK97 family phage prohead protease
MIERRYALEESPLEVEERSGSAPKIRGLAAVYNSRSKDLGGFREVIEPGAFDHLLARQRPKLDVVGLFNHDASAVLGRTTSGTLRLWSDDRGLRYEIDPPDTTLGRDVLTLLRRGDLTGSSFAFTVDKDGERYEDTEDGPIRYISRASGLFDVSPVTSPAYEATSASVRSFEEWRSSRPVVVAVSVPVPLTCRDQFNLARARALAFRSILPRR